MKKGRHTSARKDNALKDDRWDSSDEERAERSAKRQRLTEALAASKIDSAPEETASYHSDDDIRERDELAKRLRIKDQQRTKKIVEDRSSKNPSEEISRKYLAENADARAVAMPDLRLASRQGLSH